MRPSEDPDSDVRAALHSIWDHAVRETETMCGVCQGRGEIVVCSMAFECACQFRAQERMVGDEKK